MNLSILSARQQARRAAAAPILNILLPLIVAFVLLMLRLDHVPEMWFDEGYKASAARTLAERGVFGTHTISGTIPFDPGISSGPVDVVATTLVFQLFGRGVAQARLVSVVFTLCALAGLAALARRQYGAGAGRFIVLALLAMPALGDVSLLLIGRQVLGEPAALALITIGLLLWFRSWENERRVEALAAGLLIGLGLLSRLQVALALLPVIGLFSLEQMLRQRAAWLRASLTLAGALAVIGAWLLIASLLTPPDAAAANSIMVADAVRTNLLTGLWGRTLSSAALLITAVMASGALVGLARVWRGRLSPPQRRAEGALALFVGLYVLWFALLSVGWPRYAYIGLVFALLLLGKALWDGALWAAGRLRWQTRVGQPLLLGLLAALAVFTNACPTLTYPGQNGAGQVAAFVDIHIPPAAVIESWDWQIDAISDHQAFHHPHQRYLFEAIRQYSHEQRAFDLDYDLLQADPDYLIVGPFAAWTGIYDPALVNASFRLIASFEEYAIYERRR